jgi:hypothetical protein
MYVFAITALLGLGVLSLALIVEPFLLRATEVWALLLVGLGIGAAWLVDFSIWNSWGVPVRWDWVGVTLTGLALAGVAEFWHYLFRLSSGAVRKLNDEAATLERGEALRPAA